MFPTDDEIQLMPEPKGWGMKVRQWRERHINERTLVILLALVIGIAAGLAAVLLKFLIGFIGGLITSARTVSSGNWL